LACPKMTGKTAIVRSPSTSRLYCINFNLEPVLKVVEQYVVIQAVVATQWRMLAWTDIAWRERKHLAEICAAVECILVIALRSLLTVKSRVPRAANESVS
jgi:hypothetical protein